VAQCGADLVRIVVHACSNKRDIYAGTAVHRSSIDKCSRAASALLQALKGTLHVPANTGYYWRLRTALLTLLLLWHKKPLS
jgi:hypothetical protein